MIHFYLYRIYISNKTIELNYILFISIYRRIGKEIGAGALRMDTTSAFSAAVAERLKYKKVYDVLYSDMPDAPHPEPPHLEARVYIKEF